MADQWFIVRDDKKYGPYTSAQMREFAASGKLLPIDMVSETGSEPWLPASKVEAFFASQIPTATSALPFPAGPAPLPVSKLEPPGQTAEVPAQQGWVGAVVDGLGLAKRLWQSLSLWKKIAVVVVGLLVLGLFAYTKLVQTATGGQKSLLEILLDTGVIGGAVSLVYKILEKRLLGSSSASPQEGIAQRGAEAAPEAVGERFVGLYPLQWLVTLYVLFITALAGTVLAGLLLGKQSIWISGAAVAVVGVLVAYLSRSFHNTVQVRGRLSPGDFKLSLVIGASALLPAVLSLLFGCLVNPTWFYAVYAALVFLPAIHVVQRFSQVMGPIRSSSGLWISSSYLGVMFLACSVIAVLLSRPAPTVVIPDEVKESILGSWEETGGDGDARIEFTKGGQALVSNWSQFFREVRDYSYRFESNTRLVLDRHGSEQGVIEVLSKDEITVRLLDRNKKFTRAGKEKTDPTPAAIVGKWEMLNRDSHGSTVEFTKGGHLTFLSKPANVSFQATYRFRDASTLDIIPEGEPAARSEYVRYKVEFTSDDELMLVLKESRTRDSNPYAYTLRGKLRRVK